MIFTIQRVFKQIFYTGNFYLTLQHQSFRLFYSNILRQLILIIEKADFYNNNILPNLNFIINKLNKWQHWLSSNLLATSEWIIQFTYNYDERFTLSH